MAAVMLYVVPMMLGRTFDLATYTVGTDIFPPDQLKKNQSIQHHVTDIKYQLVESSREARDFLEVEGHLSLKVKGGMVDISGSGGYLKDSGSKDNALEVIIKVSYETVTETLPTSVRPYSDWTQTDARSLGTHFARSVTYGGLLLASVRFVLSDSQERETIKGAIQGGLQAGGTLGLNVQGHLEKALKKLESSVSMEIEYHASVPIKGIPRTVDGLMKLVNDFPLHTLEMNEGRGVPLRMELYPLASLSPIFSPYVQSSALSSQLNQLEAQFDDLRTTKKALTEWLSRLHTELPPDLKTEVGGFSRTLEDILRVFYNSIASLDLSATGTSQPVNAAFDAYKAGDTSAPYKFLRRFKKLRDKVASSVPGLSPNPGGATYVRWGGNGCSASNVNVVSRGVTVTSDRESKGSSQYFCLPDDPEYKYAGKGFPESLRPTAPFLVAPRYRGVLAKHATKKEAPLACTLCYATNRTSSVTIAGAVRCPGQWSREYAGVLMASQYSGISQYVCVDSSVETAQLPAGSDLSRLPAPAVVEATVQCGALPCEPYKAGAVVPCVVCTA